MIELKEINMSKMSLLYCQNMLLPGLLASVHQITSDNHYFGISYVYSKIPLQNYMSYSIHILLTIVASSIVSFFISGNVLQIECNLHCLKCKPILFRV